jgi:hypothetical protein
VLSVLALLVQFAGTKVQILTQKALQPKARDVAEGNVRLSYTKQGGHCGTHFTGCTGTKVQLLTLVRLSYIKQGGHCVLSLIALLVQIEDLLY